mmetsp:Transcript_24846/g.52957  ORF Transcript_24846/g.52957 Transcript_24846/m.52957 type:complete len:111 (-) Transcript_24846:152-484(-)|eukprot:CAMPEP_0172551130 /NCGR_PEP_ID=MMETSP1067-20121228/36639_1 /TAXON_ID=265564 ORGANISM="Thalassiosira punctigera, Strain Tpunct2005C2" /NCGR_SAMPLE_ID=MMETSP1067 /ASSEMBLY_ACC=CAM_ASM_000444 /LENGTH=110 /DNA_ID=CAMNT_0013338871 /DNA_START=94 /DNA_END=426 /DNA_ORIENTATION=-
MTETAPQNSLKKPFVLSISTKNPTAFKIKQVATAAHFISLVALGFMYLMEHEHTIKCFALTAVCLTLAIFIPPTGLINPDDVPEYAKNTMRYLPERGGGFVQDPIPKKKK